MTKKKVYGWKVGTRFHDADPQEIGEEIARLGTPTAKDIVEAAKRKSSPLHPLFEWDDAIAAERQRVETAQMIGRCLTIDVKMEGMEEAVAIRAFEIVTVPEKDEHAYVPILKALSNKEYCSEIIARLKHDLEASRRQLHIYAYISNHMAAAAEHVELAVQELAAAQ